jgi:galactonate dehydratase
VKISAVDAFRVSPKWLFVRVRTDEGVTGWGEAGAQFHSRSVAAAVHDLGAYLIGKNPLAIEAHWQVMRRFGFYRDGAVLSSALAALDEALWDIAGKVRGVPVHELLGGPVRDRVRAYVWVADSDFCTQPLEELLDEARGRVAQGFTAMKLTPTPMFPVGKPSETTTIVERIAALREAVGQDVDIAIDAHGQWSKATARRILPLLDPYHLLFVEEPVLPEHLQALPELREVTSTPIATGERLFNRRDFLDILRDGISVIQPDVSDAGGISETRRIAAMAETYDVTVAPHCPLGPIALAASLQIDFATPNILIQEQSISFFGEQFLDYLVDRSVFDLKDGWFSRPLGPGLGIEIDEKRVEEAGKRGFEMPDPIQRYPDGSYAEV